jgi:hypothetical protein
MTPIMVAFDAPVRKQREVGATVVAALDQMLLHGSKSACATWECRSHDRSGSSTTLDAFRSFPASQSLACCAPFVASETRLTRAVISSRRRLKTSASESYPDRR